jgi:hypothetical protein
MKRGAIGCAKPVQQTVRGKYEAAELPVKRPTIPNAKSLSPCELTGTFLINSKMPDRLGKKHQ